MTTETDARGQHGAA